MTTRFMRPAAAALLVILAACAGPRDEAEDTTPGDTTGMEGMEGTEGMEGMEGTGMMGGMMAGMRTHLEMMQGLAGDSLRAMMDTHRQMTGNMLAQMGREMEEMDMEGDAAWDATVDSLRSDLTRMRDMAPAELEAFMPAHRERVMRIMSMHEEMMGGMER